MKQDIADIVTALDMRICYIETGNPALTRNDMINMRKLPPVLNDSQLLVVARLVKLRNRMQALQAKVGYDDDLL